MVLTPHGHRTLLAGLVRPFGLRVKSGGSVYGVTFACDPEYPKFGDNDPANTGRGTNILTWRFTVPAGTNWGPSPATGGVVMDGEEPVYTTPLEPFRPSPTHACKVYINLVLRKLQ